MHLTTHKCCKYITKSKKGNKTEPNRIEKSSIRRGPLTENGKPRPPPLPSQLTLDCCLDPYEGVSVFVGDGEGVRGLWFSPADRYIWGEGVCLSRRSMAEWIEWIDVLPRLLARAWRERGISRVWFTLRRMGKDGMDILGIIFSILFVFVCLDLLP